MLSWRRGRCALGVVVVLAVLGSSNYRPDEFECEHAMAHLAECCPDFEASPDACSYLEEPGCVATKPVAGPVLTEEESECIQASDCAAIVEQELCARVAAREHPPLGAPSADAGADAGTDAEEPVCP